MIDLIKSLIDKNGGTVSKENLNALEGKSICIYKSDKSITM